MTKPLLTINAKDLPEVNAVLTAMYQRQETLFRKVDTQGKICSVRWGLRWWRPLEVS